MKYDAVVFDLLTALLDSWTLWNDVAGSPETGMTWRRRYLEITYGCGAYRPYEKLVREAAAQKKRISSKIELEISGGIQLNNVRDYAEAGADRISIGALTHSRQAIDVSLEIF